jgi:hypothetical protein
VSFAPTVTSHSCRLTARKGVLRAFRPEAIYEEPVMGLFSLEVWRQAVGQQCRTEAPGRQTVAWGCGREWKL